MCEHTKSPPSNPLKILCGFGLQLQSEPDNSGILDNFKIPNVLSLEVGTWVWSIVNLEGGVGFMLCSMPQNIPKQREGD